MEYVENDWVGLGAGRIKWDKGVSPGVSFKRYEMAYCSLIEHKETIPLLWSGMQQAKSAAEPMTAQGNKKLNEKRIHPCHKPILLYRIIHDKFIQPGWKELDTHVGSGSSRIAADMHGNDFYGCDNDPEIFYKQEKRWAEHKMKAELFT